jgi:phosphatidylglycerol:prolipoprotein diacylglycerol transferase
MQPEIHILGLDLKSFGLLFALCFLAAGALLARRLRETGRPPDWAYEIAFSGLLGGLVGSRAYFIVQHWATTKNDLLGSIFGGSGLVWYGGAIGGTIGVLAWAYYRRMLNVALLDLCAPALAIGYAIGRCGCQVSGDGDYGKPSSLPWSMAYPHGEVPTSLTVHPTPIYETLAMGLLALALWKARDKLRPGALFAWYLVGAGLERLLVEFIRRNDVVLAGLTAAQLESVALLVAGSVWLLVGVRDRAR